ncbi:unnamed protein product [Brachionus calyciflorus]|uniref:Integrase p58-like C-terminal domain-containing protein n=1 Tax=Brachionus calyciflorus TaxID=104777 RepID=A0A814HE33_9BILA|nr:unnamed protein product [Brachionus calyciflorus]
MLSMHVNDTHSNWDEIQQPVIFAYSNSKHSSTNYAPNEIVFGKLMPTTADRLCDVTQGNKNESNIASKIKDNIKKSHEKQKKQCDLNVKDSVKFAVGDYVLLVNLRQRPGQVRSFEQKFIGPFTILERIGEVNYKIKDVSSDKTQVVHYNRMRQYKVREKNSESECNFSGISFGIGNQGSQQEVLFKIFRERNAKAGATNSEEINFEENDIINLDANGEKVNLVNNLEQMNNIDENFGELRDVQTNLELISQNLVENTTPESSQGLNVNQLVNQNQSKKNMDQVHKQLVASNEKNQAKPDITVQINVENR